MPRPQRVASRCSERRQVRRHVNRPAGRLQFQSPPLVPLTKPALAPQSALAGCRSPVASPADAVRPCATTCAGSLLGQRSRLLDVVIIFPARTKARNLCQNATGKRLEPASGWFVLKLWNEFERNAPESLTRQLYDFVHGHIWPATRQPPLHHVFSDLCQKFWNVASLMNERWRRQAAGKLHWALADVLGLAGCGAETNWVACMTPVPIGVGTATR